MKSYFAHSNKNPPPDDWQLLKDHLENVARLAGKFAGKFGASDWGYLAGLWHDLGKYSTQFQSYLKVQNEACDESLSGRVDHSSAGAQHAVGCIPLLGHLLAYPIAGHHAGLLDGRSEYACQEKRLQKKLHSWEDGLQELPKQAIPSLPSFVREAFSRKDAFSLAFFARMLFSCLVDADFLDTEQILNPGRSEKRSIFPCIEDIAVKFRQSLEKFELNAPRTPINILRHSIRMECEQAADLPPGFFSLTVPTGGGKTLSSLAFALKHSLSSNPRLKRIIYVVPFTTIIEQNAAVFRRHLGKDAVLEHHSNLDPEKETTASRLASENWDAPLIVTTSVQFYESLFASKSSRCRKLHRLARSVIILDEAQTIPVEYLKPCLRVLKELVANYNSTVVLCTATQPEIRQRRDFQIGISGVREITSNPEELYSKLKRVIVRQLGKKTDEELKKGILNEERVLCIVNTTKHARLLFDAIGPEKCHFHLSARMCPAHRQLRLWQIRRALRMKQICRVVSTQVVEAGVDIDFPVVYRALAGLDSIAQAAGRCNRNGELSGPGRVYLFTTEHIAAERYFKDTTNCAAVVMELFPDPLDLEANEKFFQLYYWDQKTRWDAYHIMDNFHLIQDQKFPFNFLFSRTARDFHLIDKSAYCNLIIPWGRKGRELCERLRCLPEPGRDILRQAQRFMVQVHRHIWDNHIGQTIRLIYDNLGILESPETHYSKQTGLNLDAEGPGIYFG